ncbi:MAG TPA: PilZ domain-containing protein, partial [Gammaproteobacteria bacterium]|nr:PilZ domain-containing protein [Gammaproteobacteria bacterium]
HDRRNGCNTMLHTSSEKRRFPRIKVHCAATFREEGGGRTHEGLCLEISGNGILLQTPEPLAPGTRLEVSIRPLNDITPPLDAMAEVVRTDPGEAEGQYRVAAEIQRVMD